MRMSIDWLPLILQTSDPLFPTGAYAHSLGLEEWVRLSGAQGEEGLCAFLELQVLPALTYQELPYLRLVHAAGDLAEVCGLDREINGWKIASELREASVRLGGRRLDIILKTASTPLLASLRQKITAAEMFGHHLTVSAAQYAEVPLRAALMTYLYQSLAGFCVAALKLLRIGQESCQRALRASLLLAEEAIDVSLEITRDCAGWFNPLLEIASMRHETAFERMFIS